MIFLTLEHELHYYICFVHMDIDKAKGRTKQSYGCYCSFYQNWYSIISLDKLVDLFHARYDDDSGGSILLNRNSRVPYLTTRMCMESL